MKIRYMVLGGLMIAGLSPVLPAQAAPVQFDLSDVFNADVIVNAVVLWLVPQWPLTATVQPVVVKLVRLEKVDDGRQQPFVSVVAAEHAPEEPLRLYWRP